MLKLLTSTNIRQEFVNSNFEYPSLLGPQANRGWALSQIISKTIPLFITISGVGVLVYLILGGWNWLTAGDDETKVETAKSRITNALIGITIVASSLALYSIISKYFGLSGFDSNPCDGVSCPPGFICNPATGGCDRP
jgi:hypothetical protein